METAYYTPKEVAELLKLRVHTVYDYIRKGRLPAIRLGNRCRIAKSDLNAFLEEHRPTTVRPAGPEPGDATLAARLQISPEELRAQNERLRRRIQSWMADESGYDEWAWPIIERMLEENPVRFREWTADEDGDS